jgi:hypothetical protein
MIRAIRLAVSRPMYAFNPSTWRPHPAGSWFVVDAVWFRRKNGRTLAAMGTYHPMVMRRDQEPADGTYESWIGAADDNRYGGNHLASWDGAALLCTDPPAVPPEVAAERTAFLDAMLKGYPDPPPGHDGWWTFPRGGG